MTIAGISLGRPARTTAPAVRPAAPAHDAQARIGAVGRTVERLTRPLTIDLFDIDLQLESADIEYELRRGRR